MGRAVSERGDTGRGYGATLVGGTGANGRGGVRLAGGGGSARAGAGDRATRNAGWRGVGGELGLARERALGHASVERNRPRAEEGSW